MENKENNIVEKKAYASIFDLNMSSLFKFSRDISCIFLLSLPISATLALGVDAILSKYIASTILLSLILIPIISYIITFLFLYNTSCKTCKDCKLDEVCKKAIKEKQEKFHLEYINNLKNDVEICKNEINRLRVYINKLLKLNNNSKTIKDEINNALNKIEIYEDRINRHNEIINK